MATYRVHTTRDYTIMSNEHLRNKNMSLKAKGLLSVMLSLPETWDYSMNGLCAICKENISAVKSTLNELRDLGYLVITKKMPNETESGRIEYEYDIYETPKQALEKQGVENLGVEYLPVENPIQLNTNKAITNESITKKSNTEYIKIIVSYLNEKIGKDYKPGSKDTQKHINARLAEGFTVDQFKTVIDKKCAEWIGTEWEQYLRPSTLFGSKFEAYLNAPVIKRKTYGKTGVEIEPMEVDDLAGIF